MLIIFGACPLVPELVMSGVVLTGAILAPNALTCHETLGDIAASGDRWQLKQPLNTNVMLPRLKFRNASRRMCTHHEVRGHLHLTSPSEDIRVYTFDRFFS